MFLERLEQEANSWRRMHVAFTLAMGHKEREGVASSCPSGRHSSFLHTLLGKSQSKMKLKQLYICANVHGLHAMTLSDIAI